MDTSLSLAAGLTRTPIQGWIVVLLSRLQASSVILTSYTFGVFLPFISQDLHLSPLEAGLLQSAWWVTSAVLALPCSVWFSRVRPVPLVLVSLLLGLPFLVLQGLARTFLSLFLARFFFVLCHLISTPARPLLLQQWAAPPQYALLNAVGLSLHSLLLAATISSSAWLITTVGSWRLVYGIHGVFLGVQTLVWWVVAREDQAPVSGLTYALEEPQPTPLRALRAYPQGWLLGLTMLALSATWTAIVTFLPTLLLEQRGMPPARSGPLLGCLYYGLIPCALLGGVLEKRVQHRKLLLWVPALCNTVFGVLITYTSAPWLLMVLLTGVGVIWIVSPVMDVLPFEFPGIRPREVAVVTSLVKTCSGLGFALGPMVVGLVAQLTGSLQRGLLVLCVLTGVGVMAGWWYPSHQDAAGGCR
jgi:MFS transporter, ACS family, D-galactonate transporter